MTTIDNSTLNGNLFSGIDAAGAKERRSRKLPTLDGRPQARRFAYKDTDVWVSTRYNERGRIEWLAKIGGKVMATAGTEEAARMKAKAVIDTARNTGKSFAEAAQAVAREKRHPALKFGEWLKGFATGLRKVAAMCF